MCPWCGQVSEAFEEGSSNTEMFKISLTKSAFLRRVGGSRSPDTCAENDSGLRVALVASAEDEKEGGGGKEEGFAPHPQLLHWGGGRRGC